VGPKNRKEGEGPATAWRAMYARSQERVQECFVELWLQTANIRAMMNRREMRQYESVSRCSVRRANRAVIALRFMNKAMPRSRYASSGAAQRARRRVARTRARRKGAAAARNPRVRVYARYVKARVQNVRARQQHRASRARRFIQQHMLAQECRALVTICPGGRCVCAGNSAGWATNE